MGKTHTVKFVPQGAAQLSDVTVDIAEVALRDSSGREVAAQVVSPAILMHVGDRVQVSYVLTDREALRISMGRSSAAKARKKKRLEAVQEAPQVPKA